MYIDETTDVIERKEHRVRDKIPRVEGGADRTPTSRRQSLFQRGSTSTRGIELRRIQILKKS